MTDSSLTNQSKFRRTPFCTVTVGLVSLAVSNAATAQAPAPSGVAASTRPDELQEIVVSAEKRESTVQKTPISMTAITGAELDERGISGLLEVAQETPGVSFKTAGPGQTEYEIRGLTSSGGYSPTVGFYLDEAPVTSPAQSYLGKIVIDPDLYDLNRVEVLRGPQGTLYGSGSMGGTIKLITNKPELNQFAASSQASGSGTQGAGGPNYALNAMVNLPLVQDTVALRLVGTDKYTAGWINRVVLDPFPLETNGGTTRGNVLTAPVSQVARDVNGERIKGARASVLLQLGDRLTITPTVLYQRIGQGGPNTIDNPPGNQEAHYQPFDIPEPFHDTFTLYSLPVELHMDGVDISFSASRWTRNEEQVQDISEPMQELFGFPSFYTQDGGIGGGSLTYTDSTRQASEELRLASNGSGPFQWLLGGFYSDFKSNSQFYSLYAGFAPLFGTDDLGIITQPIYVKQKAVFGEASYNLTSQLKATAGLRYYSYSTNETTVESGLSTASGGPNNITVGSAAAASGVNPKFNLAYSVTDDLLLYGTAAKGFRPGAGNQPVPLTGPPQCLTGPGNLNSLGLNNVPGQFDPDTVWSYELGEKARLDDRRIVINGDVYYEKWSKVQQQVSLSCGFFFTANAGDASVYGSELEIVAKLTSQWTLNQSLGYTHATFDNAAAGTGVTAGEKLLNVPDFTATTSIVYTRPLSDRFNLIARGSYSYVGPMQDLTYTRNDLPGYSLVGARLGVDSHSVSGFLFVDNLTDRFVYLGDAYALSAQIPTLNRVVTNQPRTIGLKIEYRY
jgi:iron complex outermembrane recepter protein